MTPRGAQALIEQCAGDLAPGPYVQSADEILREPARFARIRERMDLLLDRWMLPHRGTVP
jgi:hypothetical protein